MSEDVPPYGSAPLMAYVFRCPHCGRGPITLDHADLRPVQEQLLGAEWQCSRCEGWARVRVAMPDRELTVEKGSAPASVRG
jgi:ribosomal protein S27AE